MSKKEVVAKKEDQLPAYMQQNASRGSENVGTDDMQMPRIDVLQDLSPQLKKSKPEYIEGSAAGILFNTLTGELYGDNLLIIPVYWKKHWLIWKDQNKGGGLRGIYDNEHEAKAFVAAAEDSEDLEAVETAENVVLIVSEDGDFTEAVLALSKSKMKVNRKFNSLIRLHKGDRFSRLYVVRPVLDQNPAGQDYYNLSVDYARLPDGSDGVYWADEEQYKYAERLYDNIVNGARTVKTNHEQTGGDKAEY